MGMQLYLCRLSAKRQSLLQEDPDLVWEVIQSDAPGLLRVGKAWDALRHVVGPWDIHGALDGLLTASDGDRLEVESAFGRPCIFNSARVEGLAVRAAQVPSRPATECIGELAGTTVHGDYFDADDPADLAETAESLDRLWIAVRALIEETAEGHEALLAVIA